MRRAVVLLVAVLAGGPSSKRPRRRRRACPRQRPYRAFQRSELGAGVSFPDGGGTGFEGVYRYARGTLDVGLRGGIFDRAGPATPCCSSASKAASA